MGILRDLLKQGVESSRGRDSDVDYSQQNRDPRLPGRDMTISRDDYDDRRYHNRRSGGLRRYNDDLALDGLGMPPPYEENNSADARARSADYTWEQNYRQSQPSQVPPAFTPVEGPLSLPVIIPPKRPGSINRGFVAAYAPSLEACGIDQLAFTRFLDDVNDGFKKNKALIGLQVVCAGVGFAPSAIAMGVSMAVSRGAKMANNYQTQHKTNVVLDRYNAELFAPRGVFAMIMKYEPLPGADNRERGPPLKRITGAVTSLANANGGEESTWSRDYTAGTARGADALPTKAAPLVYLDKDLERNVERDDSPPLGQKGPASLGNKASRAYDSLNSYLDKRARARYVSENGQDALALPQGRDGPPRGSNFGSSSNRKGIVGLARGELSRRRGNDDKYMEERAKCEQDWQKERVKIIGDRKGRRETEVRLAELDEEYREKLGELQAKEQEDVSKDRLTTDIIYLMIVNRPSDQQLQASESELDRLPVAMENIA